MSLVEDSSSPRPTPLLSGFFWGGLVVSYLFTRLFAIFGIPVFIDEAIHIDWAHPSIHTFLPVDPSYDGKWLSIRLFALVTRLPIADHVVAARLSVSILGLTAAVAIYLIGRDLFSRVAGAASAILYVVLPFTLIYNSLALADSVQLAFGTWAVFAAVRVTRSARWMFAAIALPFLLVATILSKFSAIGFAILPALSLLLLMRPAEWRRGLLRIAPAVIVALGLVAWLGKHGMLEVFKTKASSSWREMTALAWQNLFVAGAWLWGLLTPSIAILAIVSLGWLLVQNNRGPRFITGLLCLTVLPVLLAARVWYPRYLLLSVVPIVLAIGGAAGSVVAQISNRSHRPIAGTILAAVLGVVVVWPIARSGFVLFDLPDANLPELEQWQLVSGWPSGYGMAELVSYLREQAQATPGGITVARTIFNDHPLHTLNVYLAGTQSLSLFTLGDDNPNHVAELARLSTERRVLFVLLTDNGAPEHIRDPALPLLKCGTQIWSYTRPKGTSGLIVYELRCDENQIKSLTTTNKTANQGRVAFRPV